MRIYKFGVNSWGETLFEDLYVSKENAIKAALEWLAKKSYIVGEIDAKDILIKEYSCGDVNFYTPKGTCISDVYIDAIDTVD